MMLGNRPSLLFITLMSHKYAYQAIMKYERDVADPEDAAFLIQFIKFNVDFSVVSYLL